MPGVARERSRCSASASIAGGDPAPRDSASRPSSFWKRFKRHGKRTFARIAVMSTTLQVIEPATEQLLAEVPRAGAAETDAAARRLFTTPQQRFLRLIRNQPVELLPNDAVADYWT